HVVDRNAAPAFVAGPRVVVAHGVVELADPGSHQRVAVGQLSEVNFRPLDAGRLGDAAGRDVLDPKHGQTFWRRLVDGTHDEAVAVGVLEVLVDPRAVVDLGYVQLPHRGHHLAQAPLHPVTGHVHVGEPVVKPDFLQLAESAVHGPPVPQAHVVDGAVVGGQLLRVQVVPQVELLLFDAIQVVAEAGQGDAPGDVR